MLMEALPFLLILEREISEIQSAQHSENIEQKKLLFFTDEVPTLL
jgi:hypothetical protein